MATIRIGKLVLVGNSLQIDNNSVYVDGTKIDDLSQAGIRNGIVEVRVVEGVLDSLRADGSVTTGSVKGSVKAGGSVTCDCVGGDVSAGGSVRCGRVGGDVSAGGSVRHA